MPSLNRIHQAKRPVRSGFTLIEVVTSLAIMSVLMLGLSGAVMIGAHAVPTTTDIGLADQMVINATNQLRTDLRSCTRIQAREDGSTIEMQLTIKPTGSAGAPSSVRYAYSKDKDTLSRTVDALDPVVVLSGLTMLVVEQTKDGTDASMVYVFMVVDDTIQRMYEMHIALPDKPETNV